MRQVVQEVAVEKGLALLWQAYGRVDLGFGLARQQGIQKMHIGRRRFHVDQEVGPRKAEQRAQVVRSMQQGVDPDLAGRRMQQGDGKGVQGRSEEHTSELQSLMRISYAVFCLKTKNNKHKNTTI